jgi:c-di-GMP-binding flagellar brake protein YcgR
MTKTSPPEHPKDEPNHPPAAPETLELLQRLEKSGVQLLVRPGGPEEYTSEVVGVGMDAFFIDTLSPPEGDRWLKPGKSVGFETLFQGITYTFEAEVKGKVQFIDELPAFKLEYPRALDSVKRRRSPRVETAGDASLSFLQPFAGDGPVVNLSEGGLAFEYESGLGRLRKGTLLKEVLLELGEVGIITVQGRIVGNVVAELGGLSLPRRYRASLSFHGLSRRELDTIRAYLTTLQAVDVTA